MPLWYRLQGWSTGFTSLLKMNLPNSFTILQGVSFVHSVCQSCPVIHQQINSLFLLRVSLTWLQALWVTPPQKSSLLVPHEGSLSYAGDCFISQAGSDLAAASSVKFFSVSFVLVCWHQKSDLLLLLFHLNERRLSTNGILPNATSLSHLSLYIITLRCLIWG